MSLLDSITNTVKEATNKVSSTVASVIPQETSSNSGANSPESISGSTAHVLSSASPLASSAQLQSQIQLPYDSDWSGHGLLTHTFIDEKTGMLTSSTEGDVDVPESMTVYDIYADRARRTPHETLYNFKSEGKWVSKTAQQVLEDIRLTAKGLMHYGLKRGDSVAFMCQTCYEWDVFDAAVLSIGGVLATIYDTDSAEQIRAIVNNSDARVLMVQTKNMLERADGAVDECPSLEHIACLENGALEEIQAYGHSVSDSDLDERIGLITKNDLASIVYTSGSTSAPKGVELTHECFVAFARNLRAYIYDLIMDPTGSILLFLPQAHVFARAINYGVVYSEIQIYIATGLSTLLQDLQSSRPTTFIGVPRVFEKVYNAASQRAGTGIKGRIFSTAAKTARSYMTEISDKGSASVVSSLKRTAFDPLVYKTLRDALGGRAKWLVCGGAPLDKNLITFFRGAGIPVYEGYGMTETTAPCAFTPLGVPFRAGSVGITFPGFSIRIANDGEVQIKGPSAFTRYHKNDEATVESFTEDGWIASGDLGRITSDGFLYLTGRKKDLIITAGGKNVSPTPIEAAIKRCPLISNAVVLGDKRPFISALITLDEETLHPWLENNGLDSHMSMEDATQNAAVRAEVQKYVDQANEGVSRAESVRKFIIVPDDFTQDNGLMTASMKTIRPKVIKRYAKLLDTQMYKPRKK